MTMLMSTQLLKAVAEASAVYYNYTGQSKCLNIDQTAVASLDTVAWNFQVICNESHLLVGS